MNKLEAESRAGRQGRLADQLCRMDLVVLDELGYLPFAQSGGQLLFHLISRLYERTSVIVRTGASSVSTGAASGAIGRSTIPGTMCRCWRASRERSGTARRSRTGCCRPAWSGCAASSPAPPTATARWSILTAVLSDGLPAVEAACHEALGQNVHCAGVILNILSRRREPAVAITIMTPEALRLRHEPAADCARYDSLRRVL